MLAVMGHGDFSEFAVAPAQPVEAIPDTISYEEAAGFAIAHVTAYIALVRRAGVRAGEVVVVSGFYRSGG